MTAGRRLGAAYRNSIGGGAPAGVQGLDHCRHPSVGYEIGVETYKGRRVAYLRSIVETAASAVASGAGHARR